MQHFFNLKIIKFSHYAHLFSRLYVFLVSQLGRRTQLPLNSHSFLVSYEWVGTSKNSPKALHSLQDTHYVATKKQVWSNKSSTENKILEVCYQKEHFEWVSSQENHKHCKLRYVSSQMFKCDNSYDASMYNGPTTTLVVPFNIGDGPW